MGAQQTRLTREKIGEIDQLHRKRMRSMQAVDDMVGEVIATPRKTRQLDNSYIISTSHNDFAPTIADLTGLPSLTRWTGARLLRC